MPQDALDRIWLDAPVPAWRVRTAAGAPAVVQANPPADRWARQRAVPPANLHAALAQVAGQGEVTVQLDGMALRCRAVPLADGVLLWLSDPADTDASASAKGPPTTATDAQELDHRAQLVASVLGVGFWSLDRDNPAGSGQWDAQEYRLFGRAPEQGPPSLEQWLDAYVHPQDRARVRDRVEHDSLHDAPATEIMFRLAAPDANGDERWIHSWSRRGGGARSRTSYGMHMDVTDRQRALARQAQQERLEQASRERSAFMARMSHDLRTPMNAVMGFTRLLQTDREPLSERQQQRLGYIATASEQLMGLIDNLLATATADVRPAPAPSTAGMHVLCVEDNPVNLQLVRELLALRPAIRLSTAVDGLSGVATALAEPPDLVLLDLQLPDIDGLEVLRRLRAAPTTAACRIVALSADAMPRHIKTAMAAGFDDYWTKPIQFDNFLAGIDRLAAAVAPRSAA